MSWTGRPGGALLGIALASLTLSAPLHAQDWFDLARYEELRRSDRPQLDFGLGAMQETVFYAQESMRKNRSSARSFAPRPCRFQAQTWSP